MKKTNYKKGFGLLEVLVASVIIIFIAGALVVVGRLAVNGAETQRQKIQTAYLSQEGFEMVRQIRDSNWIDGDNQTKWSDLYLNTSTDKFGEIMISGTSDRGTSNLSIFGKFVYSPTIKRFGIEDNITASAVFENITLNSLTFTRVMYFRQVRNYMMGANIPANYFDYSNGNYFSMIFGPRFRMPWSSGWTAGYYSLLTDWRPNF